MTKIVVAAVVFSALCLSACAGEDVSRDPPKVFRERLAPLLTPTAEVMKLTDDFADPDDASIALLFETVRWVDAKGGSCLAVHRIDRVRNEQGVARLAKDEIPFRKFEQKIHLVLARSVQPDGSSQDVAANAAFLQSPQRDGDASLFTDYGELVTLYPNVRPGTVCESIIVIDEPVGRIPDAFTARLSFSAYWPQARVRHVIDFEGSLADRLTITPLGSVPEPDRKPVPGATRLTWLSERIPKTRWEPVRAPFDQVGPVVYLTTLKDWNAFGDWFATLLKGRDKAQGPLADVIAAKTKDLKDAPGIVAALLTEAAREVRYTGLEFGIAGFQPQDPNQVWTNRYGDCKDKANLLRAMLKDKNVPSYLALVNTQHTGRIEKRSPDYRHFNHAILAIPLGEGKYLFCDPTIKYARPGMLRPDDTDRDVLLMKENGPEFVHTPSQNAGVTHYDFDLKMAPNGSLSGWLTIDAHDLKGAEWLEYFAGKQQRELLRDRMLAIVQGYYRAAQLIDVDPMPPEKWAGVYRIRAYFMVPGSGSGERGRDTLSFPFSDGVLPNFGDSKTRQTTYWQDQEQREIHCRVQLPDGWSALELPRPFQVESAPIGASARWESQGSTVTASFELMTHESVVPAEQFPLLYNAVTSLRVWLGKPLQIAATKGPATAAATSPVAATQPELPDFPLMSSGEGQLELVDRRFPLEGGLPQRREALQKVLQWFPEEAQTRFVANLRLEEIELKINPKNSAALDRTRNLVENAKSGVDLNYVAWGEFMLAVWDADAGLKAEAVALLTRQAGDARLSAFRRGWAAVEAARVLGDNQRDQAIALLDASLSLDSTTLPVQYTALANLLLETKKTDLLRQRLTAVVQNSPQRAGGILLALTQQADHLRAVDRPADAAALASMLEELISPRPELAHLRDGIAQLKQRLGSQAILQEIAGSLKTYLEEHRPTWWAATSLDVNVKTRDQFREAIQRTDAQGALEPYIKYNLEYLTRFAPDATDFPEKIGSLANALATKGREPELLDQLLSFLDRLPATDPWHYEGKIVRAYLLSLKKDDEGALAIYTSVAQSENAGVVVRAGARRRRGEIFERRHDYPAALAAYKELESDLTANRRSFDALLRAAFLNLERGEREEAARVLGVLARLGPREVNLAEAAAQIRDMVDLARDREKAEAFWKRQESWWPLWLDLEQKLGFPPMGDELVVPVIIDVPALGRELVQAARANDRSRVQQILRIVAHCARWQPRYVHEVAGLFKYMATLAPTRQSDIRKMILASLRGFECADPEIMRPARAQLAIHLIDSANSAEALDVLRAYRAGGNPADPLDRAMNRLWALAASQTRSAEAAAATRALEADLAAVEPFADRAITVRALANMYRAAGRTADESKLLKSELENASVKADTAAVEEFRQRYQSLQATGTSVEFVEALTKWMREQKPSWYDFAPPKDLSDYASQDLDELIRNPPATLSAHEAAKIGLLIAQAPIQPLSRRISAFEMAMGKIALLAAIPADKKQVYASVYDDPHFPEATRRVALSLMARYVAWHGDDISAYMNHPMAPGFRAVTVAWIQSARKCGELSELGAPALEKELGLLLDAPLGNNELEQFWVAYRRLLQLDPAAARRVFKSGDRLKLGPGPTASVSNIRLLMLRYLSAAERYAAANHALRDLVATRFPASQFPPPPDFRELRILDDLDSWPDCPTQLRTCVQRALSSRVAPDPTGFWRLFVRLPGDDPNGEFGLAVLRTMLENLHDDGECANVVAVANSFHDYDNPAQRDAVAAIFKPLRNADLHPLAFEAIRLREIATAFRNGRPVDFDNDFRGLKSPAAPLMQRRLRLIQCIGQKDVAGVKRILGAAALESLVDPATLHESLPAFELAGMSDEASLLREAGRKKLVAEVLQSWSSLRDSDIGHTLSLARSLKAPDAIPAAWATEILNKVRNVELRCRVQTELADLRGDWAAVLPAVNDYLKERPRYYNLYWYKGRALYNLGRKQEAAEALEVYVRFCNDDLEHGEAVELLAKAKMP